MADQNQNLDKIKPVSIRKNKETNRETEYGLFDVDRTEQTPQTSLEDSTANRVRSETRSEPVTSPHNEPHRTVGTSISKPIKSNADIKKRRSPATNTARKPMPTLTTDAASQQWFLVTNHLNLLYMLAAGMIMSPAGFYGKHYTDPSASFPGWLPLFRGTIPRQALDCATRESKHLRPCIAAISLRSNQSQAILQNNARGFRSCSLPTEIEDNTSALFLRSPLPLSLINAVYFRSQDDLDICESAARNSANTNTSRIPFIIDQKPFEGISSESWPTVAESLPSDLTVNDCPPSRGQAVGGVLAMLYNCANRSSLCCSANRIASGAANEADYLEIGSDPILAHLPSWLNAGILSASATESAHMYLDIGVELVDAKSNASSSKPVDVIFAYLSRSIPKLQDPELKKSTTTLLDDMRSTFGLGGGTISDLFDRNTEPTARALILFCLLPTCKDLLSFSHAALSERAYILAAILFGIRDGWLGLPLELRGSDSLIQFVESRMIEVEQLSRSEKFLHHSSVPRPVPLREQLTSGCFEMSSTRIEALVKFAQSQGWKEAINTIIRFPEALYNLSASREGVEITIKGIMPSFSLDIELEAILRRISVWPFAHENEFRSILQIE